MSLLSNVSSHAAESAARLLAFPETLLPAIGLFQPWRNRSFTSKALGLFFPPSVVKIAAIALFPTFIRKLSESIIQTAEQGHYSSAQLKILMTQKLDLRQAIEDSIQGSQINDAVTQLAALDSSPLNNDGTASVKAKDAVIITDLAGGNYETDAQQSLSCNFRACHTCRPYYRDRVYISFEAVTSAQFSPVSLKEVQQLPTKSARTIRSLGMAQTSLSPRLDHEESPLTTQTIVTFSTFTETPNTASTTSESSELTFKTTQTDVDELRALRRPRKRFYNIGHKSSDEIARDLSRMPSLLSRQGLKTAMQAVFRPGRESSSSGSMITLPVPRTGTVRDDSATRPVGEFDIGALRRVRRQKEKNDMRRGAYVGGFEAVATSPAMAKSFAAPSPHGSNREGSCSSESNFSVYSRISDASEIDIEGGVALVEGAIQSHASDTLGQGASGSKASIRVQTREMEHEDDETDGGVGLQGLMTQV
ncbi:hypothetical protein E8E13_006117 [Curvularia kusanoi]|uniref:Uncharacterized protein n=1 Tax=Curvularia kusanoi TaxID=90978 RepID=A0A9P4T897_CURKU|nr:hypothetical protein E8E13_006117 [Curvularia kusanoi]